jgi:hypothetical protein
MIMFLLIHVGVAMSSMLLAGIAMFTPSRFKLYTIYVLVALTLMSGTGLVIVTGSNLLQSCVTGLLYLLAVGSATLLSKYKLALQEVKN